MAIRQARLDPLALSVSGRERMFKGPTASKEQRIDFSAGIAWFGDILNNRGVRSSRLDPVRSFTNRLSVSGSIAVGEGLRMT